MWCGCDTESLRFGGVIDMRPESDCWLRCCQCLLLTRIGKPPVERTCVLAAQNDCLKVHTYREACCILRGSYVVAAMQLWVCSSVTAMDLEY